MIQLIPMKEDTFQRWQEDSIASYAQDHVQGGRWTAEDAGRLAREEFQSLLTAGLQTPDHYLFSLVHEENAQTVGALWFNILNRGGKRTAMIYDVVIYEHYRRQGYASQAFAAMEQKAQELGVETILLHVFGHNHAARALYEKLGYEIKNIAMAKTIHPLK